AWGLPRPHRDTRGGVGHTACVGPEIAKGQLAQCTGPGPAALAGIKPGDIVVKVGDTGVANFEDMAAAIRKHNGPTPVVIERDGKQIPLTVDVTSTQRYTSRDAASTSTVGAIGVSATAPPALRQYNPLSAVPATFSFTGDLAVELGKSLAKIPTKVGALVHCIGGGQRNPTTPTTTAGRSG